MINANIKKAVTDAINLEGKVSRKWLDAGSAVRADYATREALDAVRAEFLNEIIYPAMGDDAVRVMTAEIPRRGSKEFDSASSSQQAAWVELKKARDTVRGKGSVYFGRVAEYAFPKDKEEAGPTARTDDVTYCMQRVQESIKRMEKSTNPPANLASILKALHTTEALLSAARPVAA